MDPEYQKSVDSLRMLDRLRKIAVEHHDLLASPVMSERTIRTRRALLAYSFLALAYKFVHLEPTTIHAIGADITPIVIERLSFCLLMPLST